ncbi:hypothetical protein JKY72_04575 [Candidatus Gracilibacteria bacterium]|nr:hypothetical protein [Candidatus Gracilibacteria bacterium]
MTCKGNTNVNPGFEGVYVMNAVFSKGGIATEVADPSRVFDAPTTNVIQVDMRPQRFDEAWGTMMTADNALIDFSAYIFLKVAKGQSHVLVSEFGGSLGEAWKVNLEKQFRVIVRRQCQLYRMTTLITGVKSKKGTSKTTQGAPAATGEKSVVEEELPVTGVSILEIMGTEVRRQMLEYIKDKKIPVEIVDVKMSKATPNGKVIEEMGNTLAQQQRRKTQAERKLAEDARKAAEDSRAIADKAYQTQMGITAEQYIALERINTLKEVAHDLKDRPNVTLVLSLGGGSKLPLTIPVVKAPNQLPAN